MVKRCAVVNCRSGYNTTRQVNVKETSSPRKLSIFRFPKSVEGKKRWATAIGRNAAALYDVNWGVCELHFEPEHFREGALNRRGQQRKRRLLKHGAIPSVIKNAHRAGHSNTRPTLLATPTARRLQRQRETEDKVQTFLAGEKLNDLNDLCDKLQKEQLPSGFRYVPVFT